MSPFYRLTPEEHIFLAYMLANNKKKLVASWGVQALRGLVVKGKVEDRGPVNYTEYEVPDRFWDYMQRNRSHYLPDSILGNSKVLRELEECVQNMVEEATRDQEIIAIQYEPFGKAAKEIVTLTWEDSQKLLRLNKTYPRAREFLRTYNLWPEAQFE